MKTSKLGITLFAKTPRQTLRLAACLLGMFAFVFPGGAADVGRIIKTGNVFMGSGSVPAGEHWCAPFELIWDKSKVPYWKAVVTFEADDDTPDQVAMQFDIQDPPPSKGQSGFMHGKGGTATEILSPPGVFTVDVYNQSMLNGPGLPYTENRARTFRFRIELLEPAPALTTAPPQLIPVGSAAQVTSSSQLNGAVGTPGQEASSSSVTVTNYVNGVAVVATLPTSPTVFGAASGSIAAPLEPNPSGAAATGGSALNTPQMQAELRAEMTQIVQQAQATAQSLQQTGSSLQQALNQMDSQIPAGDPLTAGLWAIEKKGLLAGESTDQLVSELVDYYNQNPPVANGISSSASATDGNRLNSPQMQAALRSEMSQIVQGAQMAAQALEQTGDSLQQALDQMDSQIPKGDALTAGLWAIEKRDLLAGESTDQIVSDLVDYYDQNPPTPVPGLAGSPLMQGRPVAPAGYAPLRFPGSIAGTVPTGRPPASGGVTGALPTHPPARMPVPRHPAQAGDVLDDLLGSNPKNPPTPPAKPTTSGDVMDDLLSSNPKNPPAHPASASDVMDDLLGSTPKNPPGRPTKSNDVMDDLLNGMPAAPKTAHPTDDVIDKLLAKSHTPRPPKVGAASHSTRQAAGYQSGSVGFPAGAQANPTSGNNAQTVTMAPNHAEVAPREVEPAPRVVEPPPREEPQETKEPAKKKPH